MANEEHLAKLKEGAEAWNKWREEHPDIQPDLQGAQIGEADLQGVDLSRTQLQGAFLRGAYLQRANLEEAQLQGAFLSAASLQGANLERAQLQRAFLSVAQLQDTNFIEADVQGADLSRTQLQGAVLYMAQLQGVDLSEATFDTTTKLYDVALSDDKHGTVSVADVSWGGVNLAVLDWTFIRVLGDEQHTWQRESSYGETKDKAKRIVECQTAVRANRQLAVVLRDQGMNEEADRFAYRAQVLQRIVLRRQGLQPDMTLSQRVRKLSSYIFSGFLDLLAGYGYHPAKTLFWYLFVIGGFATLFATLGHLPPLPDALVFSFMSFHGRGFFPSLVSETNLHNPLVIFAAAEAVVGLFIEISFIATFTQRFFGR